MFIDPLFVSIPDSENTGNANEFTEITKEVIKKTTFTKGTGFHTVIGLAILVFILTYSKIPFIQESISLEKSDIRAAFWIDIGYLIIVPIAYMIPEIVQRFKGKDL